MLPTLGANVRSIAASLEIPIETARRKVSDLIAAGWIVRERNNLMFTGKGTREAEPMREAIERLAVRNFRVVSEVLE